MFMRLRGSPFTRSESVPRVVQARVTRASVRAVYQIPAT